jgi:hypothetical protein
VPVRGPRDGPLGTVCGARQTEHSHEVFVTICSRHSRKTASQASMISTNRFESCTTTFGAKTITPSPWISTKRNAADSLSMSKLLSNDEVARRRSILYDVCGIVERVHRLFLMRALFCPEASSSWTPRGYDAPEATGAPAKPRAQSRWPTWHGAVHGGHLEPWRYSATASSHANHWRVLVY